MSEKIHSNPEHHEALPAPEHHEALPVHAEKSHAEAGPSQKLEKARISVEQSVTQDNPMERLQAAEKAAEPVHKPRVDRELRAITLRRELLHIQRKLAPTQRAFSKVIHQPVIRAVSDAASQTLSRPSGLLGGGLLAFIGSSSYLYMAKHIGFSYNYLVFLLLFFGGFAVGLVLELVVHRLFASRHRRD